MFVIGSWTLGEAELFSHIQLFITNYIQHIKDDIKDFIAP